MKRALVLLLALCACDPVEIVVGGIPLESDGGRPPPPRQCSNNVDCPPDLFCEKPDCNTLLGQCHPRPAFCPNELSPVCGCNGVNYWNDCLRRDHGVAAKADGECTSATTCAAPVDCPGPGASCALLVPASSCTATPQGACWVLPPTCPAGLAAVWAPCAGGACVDGCTAIRSGTAFSKQASCP